MSPLNKSKIALILITLILINILAVPPLIVKGEKASFSIILWVTLPPVINWNPFAPGSILTGGGMLSQGGVHSFCVAPLFVLIPYKGYQDVILPILGKDIKINPTENYLEITLWSDNHWYDGRSLYPFTAKDVWTYFTVQWKIFRNFIPFLLDVRMVDDYTVRFYFNTTKFSITAPLYDYRLGKADVAQKFEYDFTVRMRFSDIISIFTWHITTPYQIFGKYAEMVAGVPVNEVPEKFNLTMLQDEIRSLKMDVPWCNGPFWADPATLTVTGVKLIKNPGYRWAKYVQYDEGEILFARAEEHMVAWMIEGRNLDTWHGISPLTLVEINKAPGGVRIAWVQSRELWGIWFNLNKYPFNITYVRQAITMLINNTEAALAYPPQVLPFKDYITSLMTTEGIPEWIKKNLYEWTYNPQKAYQLLEGVGFRRGPDGKWYTPKGEPFRFTIMCVSQWADFVALAANLASQLQQHGIEAEMSCVDVGVYWSMWMEWRFDVTLSWTAGSWTVPLSMAGINGFINSFYPAWDFTISKLNLTWPVPLKNGTVIYVNPYVEQTRLMASLPYTADFWDALAKLAWFWNYHLPHAAMWLILRPRQISIKQSNLFEILGEPEDIVDVAGTTMPSYTLRRSWIFETWGMFGSFLWMSYGILTPPKVAVDYPPRNPPIDPLTRLPPEVKAIPFEELIKPVVTPTPTPTPTPPTPTPTPIGITTITVTQIFERTVVTPTTLITTLTTMIREVDWTLTIVICVVMLIIGLVIGWLVKRR